MHYDDSRPTPEFLWPTRLPLVTVPTTWTCCMQRGSALHSMPSRWYERLQTPPSMCPTSTPSCSYWASVVTKWMRCRVIRSLDQRAITTCTKSAHPSAHCAHGTSHSSTANVEVFSL